MTLSSNNRTNVTFLAAAGLTGLSALAYLHSVGISDDSFGVTLRLSARAALVILLLVFVARPLRQLVVTPFTTAMLRNRRLMGVAFAGVHTAHLGILIYKVNKVADFSLEFSPNLLGVFTYAVILAMLITSYDRPARALGKKRWNLLHTIGLYWLFVAFANTQLPQSLDKLGEANWWLLTIIAAALVIRLTSFLAKRSKA